MGAGLESVLQNEPYFVDFLREMPEPTGEEPEDFVFEAPKMYEEVFYFTCGILLSSYYIEILLNTC